MKTVVRIFAHVLFLGLTQPAFAHGVGNGGDHIRATFMSLGNAVVRYLDESDAGLRLKEDFQLDSVELLKTLDINVIQVQSGILVDNTGSAVDAIGSPGKILLSQDRWASHFESDRDVYFLVLHEMLRASGVNDDNYIISKAISPFPQSRRILTRIASLFPIVGQTPLNQILDLNSIRILGSGCSESTGDTFSEIDLEKNILSLSLRKFNIPLLENLSGRANCALVLPYSISKGKRLVISQIDVSAKVRLSQNSQASLSSEAVFGTTGIPAKNQTLTAPTDLQGRLFLRSHSSAATSCSGSTGLLKIRVAASAQKQAAVSALNQLVGDTIQVSFAVEDCAR